MKPESRALIKALLDDAGATGNDRDTLEQTLTELVEAVLQVELPTPRDPDTHALLQGAVRLHPELGKALAGEDAMP